MAELQIGFNVNANVSQATRSLKELEATATQSAGGITQAMTASVRAVDDVAKGVQHAIGVVTGVSSAVTAVVSVIRGVVDWLANVNDEAESIAETASRAVAEANGMDLSLYRTIEKEASEAGISAEELNQKFKELGEHKITFEELATAIGKTTEELARSAESAGAMSAGASFLADRAKERTSRQSYADTAEMEREGLRQATQAIYTNVYDTRAWDALVEAGRGDENAVGNLLELYRTRWQKLTNRRVGEEGRAMLREAIDRYNNRSSVIEEIRANDEAVIAEREASVTPQETVAIPTPEARVRDISARLKTLSDQRAQALANYTKAIDAITVAGPLASSSQGTIGALFGSDPGRDNRARMEEERAQKIATIDENLKQTLDKITAMTEAIVNDD